MMIDGFVAEILNNQIMKDINAKAIDEEIAKSFIEDVEAVKDQLPIGCGDDRFKIIAMAKEDILKSTNIEGSPEEMKVLDNILFRCWQMGWLDGYRVKGDKL